jgi:hypothetical protein
MALIRRRNHDGMDVRPAPVAPFHGGSITLWIWVGIALAVIVVVGYVLSLRR